MLLKTHSVYSFFSLISKVEIQKTEVRDSALQCAIFIRDQVLDALMFEKLLELLGKSPGTIEISVSSFTASEAQFRSTD